MAGALDGSLPWILSTAVACLAIKIHRQLFVERD